MAVQSVLRSILDNVHCPFVDVLGHDGTRTNHTTRSNGYFVPDRRADTEEAMHSNCAVPSHHAVTRYIAVVVESRVMPYGVITPDRHVVAYHDARLE